MRLTIARFLILITCILTLAALPAVADVDIPEQWLGIWQLAVEAFDCDTEELLFSSTAIDTVCAGDVFQDPEPGGVQAECEADINATTYTIHCEGSDEVVPGCTVNFTYDATATLDGDTYTSTAISNITYTGDCPVIPDSCMRTVVTGTRIGNAPEPCGQTPVESQSWSTVKSLYR